MHILRMTEYNFGNLYSLHCPLFLCELHVFHHPIEALDNYNAGEAITTTSIHLVSIPTKLYLKDHGLPIAAQDHEGCHH